MPFISSQRFFYVAGVFIEMLVDLVELVELVDYLYDSKVRMVFKQQIKTT